jgi:hypothetical protein
MNILRVGLVVVWALAASAQSQYPSGGTRRSSSLSGQSTGREDIAKEILPNFPGTLRGIDGKSLTLETPDENTLLFHCSKKTVYYDGSKKIKSSDLKPGDTISVEGRKAPDGSLDAVNVRLTAKN